MNGSSLLALAFLLLAVASVLLGIVFSAYLVVGEPASALQALEGQSPLPTSTEAVLVPLLERSPVLFWLILAITFAIPTFLFSAAGVGVWLAVCRPQRRREKERAAREPQLEQALQSLLRASVLSAVGRGSASADPWSSAMQLSMLGPDRRQRLEIFLRESGHQTGRFVWPAELADAAPSDATFRRRRITARVLAAVLLGFSLLSFLYGVTGLLLFDALLEIYDLQSLPNEKVSFFLSSCAFAALALLAAAGVSALSALDRRMERRWQSARAEAGQQTLGGFRSALGLIDAGAAESLDGARVRALRGLALANLQGLGRMEKRELLVTLLERTPAPRVELGGADLAGVDLSELDLRGIRLAGSQLAEASLTGAILADSDLGACILRGVDLRHADLTGATLRRADLRNAKLHQSILRRADLALADLEGANLWQADLYQADLSGARVGPEQLRAVRQPPPEQGAAG